MMLLVGSCVIDQTMLMEQTHLLPLAALRLNEANGVKSQ